MQSDAREAPRFDFGLKVIIVATQEAHFTKNISLKGCFIPECQSLHVNEIVELAIDVPGFGHVMVYGQVRHTTDQGAGVMFVDIKNPAAKKALGEFIQVVSLCEESVSGNGLDWLQ